MIRLALPLLLVMVTTTTAFAGHSRHSYVDGGQSMNGRYSVVPRRIDGEKPKKGPTPYHWEFTWRDKETGETHTGQLDGLRSGDSNVFDPVGSHLFVAPDGETFALWTPQVMMQADAKKPDGERNDESFHEFEGFSKRLVIYTKNGEVVRQFDLDDFLTNDDWPWMHFHGRQTYWLLEYEGLHTRSAPRPFYALYRISPDYTVLEFTIGANAEATHHARQRGVEPPTPRVVRIRLTDGERLDDLPDDPRKQPGQPFVGRLADKEHRQRDYEPSLDPVRVAGHFTPSD